MSENGKKTFLQTVIILLTLFFSTAMAVSAQPMPTFALAASPSSLNLVAGSQANVVVTVTSVNGFNSPVQLSFSVLPVGVTANFNSNPVTPPAGGTVTTNASFTAASSVAGNTYYLTLVGLSGSTIHTYTFSMQVTPQTVQPDFAIGVYPTVVDLVPTGQGSATVTVFSFNGFSSSVSLIPSGEPPGVSLSLSQNQLFPPSGVSSPHVTSASSVLSISVQSWVPVGLYPLAVTGTSGPLTASQNVIVHSTQLTLQVVSPKDFTVAIAPSSLSIQAGTSTTATVTVSSFSGFSSAVQLTTNSPSGISLNFSPNPLTELSGGAATATATISVSSSTSSGTYSMLITGTSGGLTHSTPLSITVSQTASPDFTITSSSAPIGVSQGASSGGTVYVSSLNHFTSPVTLSASWFGISTQGLSFTLPGSATPPDDGSTPVAVTFSASTTAQPGTYTLNVVGTSGSISHAVNILVQVMVSGGDFSVSVSPTTINVIQGSQGYATVTLQASGTFSSPVTLTTAAVNGLSVSFNASPIPVPSAGTANAQLIVSVAGWAPTGIYPIPIIATSGSLSHFTSFNVTVIRAGLQDFAIGVSSTTIMINQGSSTTATISVYSENAFSSSVSLSTSWSITAPDGVTVNLNGPVTPLPNAVALSALTITTSPTATTGSYLLQVTGFSGSLVHTANVTIQVLFTSSSNTVTSVSGTSTSGTSTSGTSTSGTSTSASSAAPACLIATATYGSQVAPEVQLLRNFRDNSIMKTKSGSSFMLVFNAWYYSFSPGVAAYLNTHWVERTVMKGLLYPLVGILYLTSDLFSATSSYPELAVLFSGLLASSLLGAFYLGIPLAVLRARVRRLRNWKGQRKLERTLAAMLLVGLGTLAFGELFSSQPALIVSTPMIVLSTLFTSSTVVSKKLANRL
ncbi:MAG: CFI-box-CTERM domain-containing protein [Candidatus Bathyarchaeia archaeon]